MKKIFNTVLMTHLLSSIFICYITANAQHAELEWVKQIGGRSTDWGHAITLDKLGNVYTTGTFYDSINLDPGTGNEINYSKGNMDVFVSKLDADGNFIWGKSFGGKLDDMGLSISVDQVGNVYIVGLFRDTVDFDPGSDSFKLIASTPIAHFVCKLDPAGNFLWAKHINTNALFGAAIGACLDSSGNIFITSSFQGITDFDPGVGVENRTASATGQPWEMDIFLLKLDSIGDFVWVRTFGGTPSRSYPQNMGCGVTLDSANYIYMTGAFAGIVDFDPSNDTFYLEANGADVFIVKLNPEGSLEWAKSVGGPWNDAGVDIEIDPPGNILITGSYLESGDFDPGTGVFNLIGSPWVENTFILKLQNDGTFIWAKSVGGTNNYCIPKRSATDAVGNIYVCGWFGDSADFNPGSADFILVSTNGSIDPYILKLYADGEFAWAKQFEGSEWTDVANDISVNSSGSIFTTGAFSTTVDFDPGPGVLNLTSLGASTQPGSPSPEDAFIHKMICTDTNSFHLNITACRQYEYNKVVYNSAGTYLHVFPNTAGCDSTVHLHLTFDSLSVKLNPIISVDTYVLSTTILYATYQWIKDGFAMEGATLPTYTVTENGDYQVYVSDENGCYDTSDIYRVRNVSIHNYHKPSSNIYVYPNPAHNEINIHSEQEVDVDVLNVEGRHLLKIERAEAISLEDWTPGIYFLKIYNREGNLLKVEKIIRN
jgi:hypothetical protein